MDGPFTSTHGNEAGDRVTTTAIAVIAGGAMVDEQGVVVFACRCDGERM
jgi:hypothetical protein